MVKYDSAEALRKKGVPVYTDTPSLQIVEECDGRQDALETCLVSLNVKSLKNSAAQYGQYPDPFTDTTDRRAQ